MANWTEVTQAAPEIAKLTQARIEATGLALLATLRRDGFPRISGIEPWFRQGELLLGMMTGSRKALDLQRDSRMCLHNATVDKEVKEGDVKIIGRAVEIHDDDFHAEFRRDVEAENGMDPGESFHIFRVDVAEISTVRPAGDHLVIDSWREGEAPKSVKRY